MVKYMLFIALFLLSTTAMADRVVYGEGGGNPMGNSRASACQQAKYRAEDKKRDDEEVVGYSQCECDNNGPDERSPWNCAVSARLSKVHDK